MRVAEGFEESLAAKFTVLLPHLDERQRRLALGAEAQMLGHGGIRLVARAAGVREGTVARGVAAGRGTQAGGGARPGAGAGAAGPGRAGHAGGPDVTAAVDDEIDPQAGGRAGPPGTPGVGGHRR